MPCPRAAIAPRLFLCGRFSLFISGTGGACSLRTEDSRNTVALLLLRLCVEALLQQMWSFYCGPIPQIRMLFPSRRQGTAESTQCTLGHRGGSFTLFPTTA